MLSRDLLWKLKQDIYLNWTRKGLPHEMIDLYCRLTKYWPISLGKGDYWANIGLYYCLTDPWFIPRREEHLLFLPRDASSRIQCRNITIESMLNNHLSCLRMLAGRCFYKRIYKGSNEQGSFLYKYIIFIIKSNVLLVIFNNYKDGINWSSRTKLQK